MYDFDETHSIRNVFDSHAARIAVHSVSRVRPATLHMRRIPGKDHRGLIDKVDGQVLRRRRWFCKKVYSLKDFRGTPNLQILFIFHVRKTFSLN